MTIFAAGNKIEYTMATATATMTLTVNLNRSGARDFVDYARKLSFVKVEEPQIDPLAKEIARRIKGVKNGKIKTRPVEKVLSEL